MVKYEKKDFNVYLKWMQEIIERIHSYTKGYTYEKFAKDQKTVDATLMMLIQLGETAFQIEHNHPKNPLTATKALKAMRNFLVHAYHKIDTSIIRDTIIHDIPQLREEILSIKK